MTVKSWKHLNYPATCNYIWHLLLCYWCHSICKEILYSSQCQYLRLSRSFWGKIVIMKFIFLSASTYTVAKEILIFKHKLSSQNGWLGTIFLYLFILRAHLGHQHGNVVSVPHPGVTGEVLQNHHGFVEASDRLHHPEINKRRRQNHSEKKGWNGGRWEGWGEKTQKKTSQQKRRDKAARRSGGKKINVKEEIKGRCCYEGDFKR